jgi:CRISPR-associated endonuclease/helicase Cas3
LSIQSNSQFLWGKWGEQTNPSFHPLICHMIDVGVVAASLLAKVLPESTRKLIAGGLGVPVSALPTLVPWLASLHDLGKASPAFQGLVKNEWVPKLMRAAGLAIYDMESRPPHGQISGKSVGAILSRDWGVDLEAAGAIAVAVGGHHGLFPSAGEVQAVLDLHDGGQSWHDMRASIVQCLAVAFGAETTTRPTQCDNTTGVILAGLVSVADWIGSNTTYFPYAVENAENPIVVDVDAYFVKACDQAERALTGLGWDQKPAFSIPGNFAGLFGFAPNELQSAALQVARDLPGPGLVIVEAPMGEGKTEAAQGFADVVLNQNHLRGMFFALPTQATSNQIFSRTSAFLAKRYPGDAVQLLLQHGHASLAAEFDQLKDAARHLFTPSGIELDGDPTAPATLFAADWFTHRKRGLLAPFGVGTVDQILMATLRTKHVFVRLFGLANKVIIIDEVHAYDAYMSALLARLLSWLAAIGSTVVLLSATLPKARREALIQAFAGKNTSLPPATPYPRLTWVSGEKTGTVSVTASKRMSKDVEIRWLGGDRPTDESMKDLLPQLLASRLDGGGCALVLCNTVSSAQTVYTQLKEQFDATAADGQPELLLLHSRFPFDERQALETTCLRRFGKPDADGTSPHRPGRAVLVATQVVEQSLDLDFDLMISEPAPIDLLLQRAGRLHRHQRPRPEGLADPQLHVVAPALTAAGIPQFGRGTEYVYARHVLLRSWLALRDQAFVQLPSDIERLVETVYDEDVQPSADLAPPLAQDWLDSLNDLRKEQVAQQQEAKERFLPQPWFDMPLSRLTERATAEDKPNLHSRHQALTRLAEPSVSVICLTKSDAGPCLPDGRRVDLKAVPDWPTTRLLLGRSLTVSDKRIVHRLLDGSDFKAAGWSESALLRHHRVLRFDADGACPIDPFTVHLDPERGFAISDQRSKS